MTGDEREDPKGLKKKSRTRRFFGHVIRTGIFVLLALAIFAYGNMAVGYPGDELDEGVWESFYGEQEDSIDVMYYGSSASARFFNNVYAYHETGIASYQFGIASTPSVLTKGLIEYSRKTQHPKLYIIEVRPFTKTSGKLREEFVRRVVDTMRFTDTGRVPLYKDALRYMEEYLDPEDYDDSLEDYVFPLITYHERITDGSLAQDELLLKRSTNPYKGFALSNSSLSRVTKKTPEYSTGKAKLTSYQKDVLQETLDYCKTLDGDVLFVASPFIATEERSELVNSVCSYVEDEGFDCLNFNTDKMAEELGIDFDTDFYNVNHTNYLGAEKYTKWLSAYLVKNYGLEDHRGQSEYQSWEDGYESYADFVSDGIQKKSSKDIEG